VKKAKKRKRARRRLPRVRSLISGGFLAAVAGFIVLLVVYGAMGGGGHGEFVPEITETRSESHGGEPFQGGPRLHFPVDSIDMGRVPLNTNVGYAFAMTNVGDATVQIEDASVSVLDGC
jgi:hypothetical protein